MFKLKKKNKNKAVLDLRQGGSNQQIITKRSYLGWLIGILSTILLVAIVGGVYFAYVSLSHSQTGKSAMLEAVSRVGKLIILPENETPTYGTVSDLSKLKNQEFFKKAANGDEILIYQQAKLTILYRKSINKIVNIGPLIVGSSGSPYVTARFAIKNGTSNPDFAVAMAARIRQLYPNASIVSNEPASRTYPATIAIDLTKKNQPLDEQVADSLGIKAGKPPLGEPLPDGDILIIIGGDFKPQ